MFKRGAGRFGGARSSNRDEVKRRFDFGLVTPKNLPEPPPDTVANHGISNATRGDKAGFQLLGAQKTNRNQSSPNNLTFFPDAFEVGAAQKPDLAGKPE